MRTLTCLALLVLSWTAIAGDYPVSENVCGKFATYQPSTGAAFTLGGTPALSVYKDNSTTQSTTGVTLTADFDSVTGLNHYCIDTSADGTFYSADSNFDVVITTGTVDSVSVVGSVVGSFSLSKSAAKTDTAAILTDTADMQPKLGTFSDLGAGATLAGNLKDMRDNGTATYDRATDSLQAIRDRGDAAWTTGGGGSIDDGDLGIVASGTAQAGTSTTIQLADATSLADDLINCATVLITGGTGAGQSRTITDWVSSTDTATVATWTTNPSSDSTYNVFGTACGSLGDGASLTAIPWNSAWDAEVESEVDDALGGGTGTALTSIPWNAAWDTEVQSEATDALNAYDPPTRAELTSDIGTVTTAIGDVPTNSELTTALETLAAAGVYSLGYINAAGDQCVMVISETAPKLDVTCTEVP